jgi:putative membrane protein
VAAHERQSASTPRDETFLRDVLAIDRTVLANERTLLAYFRTMLALLAGAVTIMHFLDGWWVVPLGVTLLAAGPVLFGVGVRRYLRVHRHLNERRHGLTPN